jgi:hypothetical protein
MTKLSKPVRRVTERAIIFEGGSPRPMIVSQYPNGVLGFRPQGLRREELISVLACYSLAVKQRVREEMNERKAKRRVVRKDR